MKSRHNTRHQFFMCSLVAAFVVELMHAACVCHLNWQPRGERIQNSKVLLITFWSRGKEDLQWFSGSAAELHHIATSEHPYFYLLYQYRSYTCYKLWWWGSGFSQCRVQVPLGGEFATLNTCARKMWKNECIINWIFAHWGGGKGV